MERFRLIVNASRDFLFKRRLRDGIRLNLRRQIAHLAFLCIAMMLTFGCRNLLINPPRDRIRPSNQREWAPDLARMPSADVTETGRIYLRNIRNCQYVSKDDFTVDYYDHEFSLEDIEAVDFIVVPFNNTPALAHTMLSFGLRDGKWIAVSIETRREMGEKFSAALGAHRQFELIYVVADERDLIRLRTRHRESAVYVYPTVATPQQARELFVDVMDRANRLAKEPEFYHSLMNNCTTNLAGHVNTVAGDRIMYNWKVLMPAFSARYAYDLGLLPQSIPFEDLELLAVVNDLAEAHYDDEDFSQKIRSRRHKIHQLVRQNQHRQAMHGGRGAEYLDSRKRR